MSHDKLTLAVLLSASLLAAPASANILLNPDFEIGSGTDADDWLQVVGVAGTTQRVGTMPQSGASHIYMQFDHFVNPAAPTPYAVEQNPGVGTIDDTLNYDLSFYGKVDSTDFTGVDIFYQILWLDQDASHGGGVKGETLTQLIPAGINTSYQQFGINNMDAPDGTDSYLLRFQLSPGAVADIANGLYIDNVSLAIVGGNPLTGDLDSDGFVGINDLNIVLGAWNQNVPPANPLADPSGDGFVGIDDLNTVLGNWNAGTPPTVGNVPEPTTLAFLSAAVITGMAKRRRL